MDQTDYYKVLGVDRTADAKMIKNAYRELALKYHPDRNQGNPEAMNKMKAINEAYAVLSDARKKVQYDSFRSQFGTNAHDRFRKNYSDQDIFKGSDINQVLEEMARSFGLRGFDEIFKEFYGNGYKSFEFNKKGYYVKGFFFSGFFNGNGPDLKKISENKSFGKISRFLLEKIAGQKIPNKGSDVFDVIRIDATLADEGGPYAYYQKKRKKKLVVKIPPGVHDGQKIRLSGMGEEGRGGGMDGDLFLKVQVSRSMTRRIKDFTAKLFK